MKLECAYSQVAIQVCLKKNSIILLYKENTSGVCSYYSQNITAILHKYYPSQILSFSSQRRTEVYVCMSKCCSNFMKHGKTKAIVENKVNENVSYKQSQENY